jgi:hypothetical protein
MFCKVKSQEAKSVTQIYIITQTTDYKVTLILQITVPLDHYYGA